MSDRTLERANSGPVSIVLRWALRIGLGLVVVGGLTASVTALMFMSWKADIVFEGGDHFVGITRWAEYSAHVDRFARLVSSRSGSRTD